MMLDRDKLWHLSTAQNWARNWGKNPYSISDVIEASKAPVWEHNMLYLELITSGYCTKPQSIWDELADPCCNGRAESPEEKRIRLEKELIEELVKELTEWRDKNGDDLTPFLEYWHIPQK